MGRCQVHGRVYVLRLSIRNRHRFPIRYLFRERPDYRNQLLGQHKIGDRLCIVLLHGDEHIPAHSQCHCNRQRFRNGGAYQISCGFPVDDIVILKLPSTDMVSLPH